MNTASPTRSALEDAPFSPSLMKVAAVASVLSAATTFLLIQVPSLYSAPQDFAARAALVDNPWFQLRSWTYYAHPFACFVAGLGVWRIACGYDRGLALLAILFLGLWGFTEALQQALTNVAAGWNWFPAFAGADAAGRALIEERWTMFYGLWDGLYFLLLTGFLLANLIFGLILVRGAGVDRLVGLAFLVLAGLTVLNFFAGYGGPAWTGAVAGAIYPILQPLVRLALGLWLWKRRMVA